MEKPESPPQSTTELPLNDDEKEWLNWLENRDPKEVARMLHKKDQESRSAGKDFLTGLQNRAGFQNQIERTRAEAKRDGEKLLFVMIDLDNLKQVNDGPGGHPTGDEYIRKAAINFSKTFRASDLVARYGGDELVALVAVKSTDTEEILVNRIRENMNRTPASVGYAYFDDGMEFDDAYRNADIALYNDKETRKAGRR